MFVIFTYSNIVLCQEFKNDTLFVNYLSGKWYSYKFIPGDISNIGNEEASAFLGRNIIFKKSEAWIWGKKWKYLRTSLKKLILLLI